MDELVTDTGWVVLKYNWIKMALKVASNPLRTDGYRSLVVDGDSKKIVYEPFMGRLEWCRFGGDIEVDIEEGYKYYVVSGIYGDKLMCAFTDLGVIEVGGDMRIESGRLVVEIDRDLDDVAELAASYGGVMVMDDIVPELYVEGVALVGVYAMRTRLYFTGGPYGTVRPVAEIGGTGMFRQARNITPDELRKIV